MEEVISNTSAATMVQDDSLSLDSSRKGDLNLNVKMNTMSISSVSGENIKANNQVKGNVDIDQVDCSSQTSACLVYQETSDSSSPKNSPTLIEHAFNVMKNLFSPDKTKSKTSNVPSPITQQRSSSVSPCNSVYNPKKSEFSASEGGSEISNTFQPASGENSLKDQLYINQLGIMHNSLTLDALNNTDDSFLTSVSLIDESFQSAVTHLDENGETLKNVARQTDNCLDFSRNMDLIDPYNETFENSDYCLENTTLKNGSFASEGAQQCNTSNESKNGSKEAPNNTPVKGLIENAENVHSGVLKENFLNVPNDNEKKAMNENMQTSKITNGDWRDDIQKWPVDTNNRQINNQELSKSMEKIFVNRSFEKRMNISNSSEPRSATPSEICENPFMTKTTLGETNKNEVRGPPNGIEVEIPVEEKENFLGESISTTTVVLNAVDSVEIDNMLFALKSDDSTTNTSSVTSSEVNFDVTSAGDEKQFLREPVLSQFSNIDLCENNSRVVRNSCSFTKSQEKKFSKSEGNSPDKLGNSSRQKLNKSDELITHKSLSEFPKCKRTLHEKEATNSCVDISLIKNSEASEPCNLTTHADDTMGKVNPELKTILSPASIRVKGDNVEEGFEQYSEMEFGKSEGGLANDESNIISVVSQESYTVLRVSTNLNRPIIGSLSGFDGNGTEEHSPRVNPKSDIFFDKNAEERKINELKNDVSSDSECLIFSSKQSTPICGGTVKPTACESTQTFVSPTASVPQRLESNDQLSEETVIISKADLLGKAMQIFSSNEEPTEYSPVIPVNDSEILFSNSVESYVGEVSNHSFPYSLNKTHWDISQDDLNKVSDGKLKKSPKKWNETFDKKSPVYKSSEKKLGSPAKNKLNQTFDKKSESSSSPKLNLTYDKNTKSPGQNKLNQTYDKKSESLKPDKLNQTFDKTTGQEKSSQTINDKEESREKLTEKRDSGEPHKLNETYDKCASPGGGRLNLTYDKKTESPVPPGMNQTFSKEISKEKTPEEVNKTFDKRETQTEEFGTNIGDVDKVVEKKTTSPRPSPNGDSFDEKFIEGFEFGSHKELLNGSFVSTASSNASKDQTIFVDEKLSASPRLLCDPELAQLIKEQFSSKDIEKICSVVDDLSSLKLSSDILKASEQFDKSFHENVSLSEPKSPQTEIKSERVVNPLSPKSFDFLSSIGGKPTGRDLSRESLYVKFDPLVQPSHANSLIDFTKEVEALTAQGASPENEQNNSICENLLAISPQKKPDDIVPPLTPLSHKNQASLDKAERLKELQNEIYFLKNLYAERERTNKAKMDDFESQITKLTGHNCILEDKLKESNEREKSLVKKLKEQTQNIGQLKVIMEEYIKVISRLTTELESVKKESAKQIEGLSAEKDSYMTHLQNTEAAFTDVHAKYEKSKKSIASLRTNEALLRNTIAEQANKLEEFKGRARENQEKAFREYQKVQEELNETKSSHSQETARLRAQLRKTELKLEAMQESLDQKIKENQQLTAICDELIEGKK